MGAVPCTPRARTLWDAEHRVQTDQPMFVTHHGTTETFAPLMARLRSERPETPIFRALGRGPIEAPRRVQIRVGPRIRPVGVPFDRALDRLDRVHSAPGWAITPVDTVDRNPAFDLDNRLRCLVPAPMAGSGIELGSMPSSTPTTSFTETAIWSATGRPAQSWEG